MKLPKENYFYCETGNSDNWDGYAIHNKYKEEFMDLYKQGRFDNGDEESIFEIFETLSDYHESYAKQAYGYRHSPEEDIVNDDDDWKNFKEQYIYYEEDDDYEGIEIE